MTFSIYSKTFSVYSETFSVFPETFSVYSETFVIAVAFAADSPVTPRKQEMHSGCAERSAAAIYLTHSF
jgi:hypothetical protein